ncbi:uncharacterized protein LOC131859315 [Cryptomeria japonica]|uniref:uncharacterized protein LOC131859315 n=1 Tax=Cryptomeria japonica TaxID=3369 RepID=UPI0027DA4FA3|nr:uncharacterized protein LOC131859315 [Cryptomeria japonica]
MRNVRGPSTPDKRRLVKRALARSSSDIVAFQETKLNKEKVNNFISYCKVWEGIFQEASGAIGGLGVIWNPAQVKVTLMEKTEHWMICNVFSFKEELNFPLINVYGLTKTLEKYEVWQPLTKKMLEIRNDKVVVVGDFNALLDLDEKKGGLRMSNKIMEDFRDFVMQNHLMDVVPKNGTFTWMNRRAKFAHISERLDRHLIGESWLESSFQGSIQGIDDNGWPIKKVHLGGIEGRKKDFVDQLGNSLHAQNERQSGSEKDELVEFGVGCKIGLEDVQ